MPPSSRIVALVSAGALASCSLLHDTDKLVAGADPGADGGEAAGSGGVQAGGGAAGGGGSATTNRGGATGGEASGGAANGGAGGASASSMMASSSTGAPPLCGAIGQPCCPGEACDATNTRCCAEGCSQCPCATPSDTCLGCCGKCVGKNWKWADPANSGQSCHDSVIQHCSQDLCQGGNDPACCDNGNQDCAADWKWTAVCP